MSDHTPHLPEELRYTAEHVWTRNTDEGVILGITDHAQSQLGEIVFVDLPDVDTHFAQGESFGTVESLKSVNDLYMPLAGRVAAVNDAVTQAPTLVNLDCYGQGWMLRIIPDQMAHADDTQKPDADCLLHAAAYRALL